jgi:hypothetical protein
MLLDVLACAVNMVQVDDVPELPLVVDNSLAGVVKTSAAYKVQLHTDSNCSDRQFTCVHGAATVSHQLMATAGYRLASSWHC